MESAEALSATTVAWKLVATGAFIALNAFFVAAEFALIKVRTTRIEALAGQGKTQAVVVRHILGDLDRYLSACQLGITVASLVLGWLAEPAVAHLLLIVADAVGVDVSASPMLDIAALAIALTVITILHVTVGEQAPKMWALQKPEAFSLVVAQPLKLFEFVFRPLIMFINVLSNGLLRLVGVAPAAEHGEAPDISELRAVLGLASQAGHISKRQLELGRNVLGIVQLQVRHVMVPRTQVVALQRTAAAAVNLQTVRESSHSRFPFCDPDLDHVVGLVHVKDVLASLIEIGPAALDLTSVVRPIPSVPDTQSLSAFIVELKGSQTHCALVVDEHGTTVGMAFLEDAIEKVVGPISDEFDGRPPPASQRLDGVIEMAGNTPVPEAAHMLGIDLETTEESLGGLVTARLGHLPREGETLVLSPYEVTIAEMSGTRVIRLRFRPSREGEGGSG